MHAYLLFSFTCSRRFSHSDPYAFASRRESFEALAVSCYRLGRPLDAGMTVQDFSMAQVMKSTTLSQLQLTSPRPERIAQSSLSSHPVMIGSRPYVLTLSVDMVEDVVLLGSLGFSPAVMLGRDSCNISECRMPTTGRRLRLILNLTRQK